MMDKRYQHRVSKLSAWSELVGYVGNIILSSLYVHASLQREQALELDLRTRKKVPPPPFWPVATCHEPHYSSQTPP